MTKKIDSDALGVLNKSLGLTGAGSPTTELADGVVDQVLSVGEVVRRGRTQAGSEGIYTAIMQNVHTDAETITTIVNPFDVAVGVIPPYPDPLPVQFDLWLLTACVRKPSGTGTMTAALSLQYASMQQGWGVDDSGVAVVESAPHTLAYWDLLISLGTTFGIDSRGVHGALAHIGVRIPRNVNAALRFISVSSATATFNMQLVFGVFPVALGQDGLV